VISSPLLSQKNGGGNVTLSKKSNNLMLFMKEEKNQIFYSWFKPTSLAYDRRLCTVVHYCEYTPLDVQSYANPGGMS
jgi:hypothetical protein